LTQKQIAMIREFEANVRAVAGTGPSETVLYGATSLDAKTDGVGLAEWVRGAIGRLDATVPLDRREKIMAACGRTCAKTNHRAIEKFKKRRAKHGSLDDFLDAEARIPMKGTKLWREGDAVVQAYCPSEYAPPMRCYCALVRGLPMDETTSPTYCLCSRAFVQQMWEETLGRPVSITLLRSALSGATECQFRIEWQRTPGRGALSG
jgi:hypothetical protein